MNLSKCTKLFFYRYLVDYLQHMWGLSAVFWEMTEQDVLMSV